MPSLTMRVRWHAFQLSRDMDRAVWVGANALRSREVPLGRGGLFVRWACGRDGGTDLGLSGCDGSKARLRCGLCVGVCAAVGVGSSAVAGACAGVQRCAVVAAGEFRGGATQVRCEFERAVLGRDDRWVRSGLNCRPWRPGLAWNVAGRSRVEGKGREAKVQVGTAGVVRYSIREAPGAARIRRGAARSTTDSVIRWRRARPRARNGDELQLHFGASADRCVSRGRACCARSEKRSGVRGTGVFACPLCRERGRGLRLRAPCARGCESAWR